MPETSLFDSYSAGAYQVNPPRGCGLKVRGGSYLEADTAPEGTLNRTTWVLGNHYSGGINVYTDGISRRGMSLFNPSATLFTGEVVYDPLWVATLTKETEGQWLNLLRSVGTHGLLDYVGHNNYTPWSFTVEAFELGPSRRVTRSFMESIAPYLPLPVFFAHRGMPIFEDAEHAADGKDRAIQLVDYPDTGYSQGPTWYGPTWGMGLGDYPGDDHYLLPILRAMDECEGDLMDSETYESVGFYETLWLASWFTRGTYVLAGDDDDGSDAMNVQNINI